MIFCLTIINLELIGMVTNGGLNDYGGTFLNYTFVVVLLLLLFTLFIDLHYRALSSG
jgi:hypothetical protein